MMIILEIVIAEWEEEDSFHFQNPLLFLDTAKNLNELKIFIVIRFEYTYMYICLTIFCILVTH